MLLDFIDIASATALSYRTPSLATESLVPSVPFLPPLHSTSASHEDSAGAECPL